MYQLMIIDFDGNIAGVYTDSSRLPDLREVMPNGDYIGVETPYNLDLLYNSSSYIYRNGTFIKKEPIPYRITKLYLEPDEVTSIYVPKGTTASINGMDYEIDDGCIEYSNPNVGVHQIMLKISGYAQTPVYIEVMEG
ncbi:MAG TPA: hypothetical protein VHP38_00835 [Ruminiclostridium sp.]|nr:hypothetical protein [Ruminiclostridium sp.]